MVIIANNDLLKPITDLSQKKWERLKLSAKSLMYNHFLDQSYAVDVFMEPMFWFVDNFTFVLGPLFVAAVCLLTASVVGIAYWIGLPYWWNRNPHITVILLIIGNWLLMNNLFHYYMAVTTPPGYPPEDEIIPEAVSICKKCISPKPPRTHHCSVCNRCILKMDHHCPWLNNCVGHFNHRYFYLYMVYTVVGVLFIIIFGVEIALTALWYSSPVEPELDGHPIRFNKSGAIIRMPELSLNISYTDVEFEYDLETDNQLNFTPWERRAILYMTLLNTGVLIALGGLMSWHGNLVSRGETSIEANINKAETKRLTALNKTYVNPYNFGSRKNWKLFLGIVRRRSFLQHVLLPSSHKPEGDGLTWHTVHDEANEWP